MDEKNESHINVKVEIDSEDENIEGTIGQSSFDLAMNKPDVIIILYIICENIDLKIYYHAQL